MRRIIVIAAMTLLSAGAFSQERNIATVTLNSDTRISTALNENERLEVDSVVLKGYIMLADFNTLHEMVEKGKLTGIDLSGTDCISVPDMAFMPSKVNSTDSKGYRMGLRYVTFPECLLQIGSRAFQLNDLQTVTLPNSLVYIGDDAFNGCSELKSVKVCSPYVPKMFLSSDVFSDAAQDAVLEVPIDSRKNYIDDERWHSFSVVKENDGLFITKHVDLDGNSLSSALGDDLLSTDSLVITGCLMKSDNAALYEAICNGRLRSVDMSGATVEDNKLQIVRGSVADCSRLRYFRFPKDVSTISRSFNHARLLDLKLPESIRVIDTRAFIYTTIYGDLHIPEGVTTIGEMAFRNSDIHGNLYLPSTLSDIYALSLDLDYTMYYPSSWSVYINRITPPAYGKGGSIKHTDHPFDSFGTNELPASWTLYVPVGTAETYKADKCWGCFKNIIETPDLTGTSGIAAPNVEKAESKATRIYTLDGRYVGTDMTRLGKGVYVVNGKKVVR